MENVQSSTGELESSGAELIRSNDTLNTGIEDVMRNVQNATSAISEMEESASTGAESIAVVVESMRKMEETMNHFKHNIDGLSSSVSDIEGIVGLINDIADQTNLLALNAAIEAARAGEHGRGFAVVADEVRQLAEKTQKATTEIKMKLNVLKEHSDSAVRSTDEGLEVIQDGVERINHTNATFQHISQMINGVRDRMQDLVEFSVSGGKMAEIARTATRKVEEIIQNLSSQTGLLRSIASYFNFNTGADEQQPPLLTQNKA